MSVARIKKDFHDLPNEDKIRLVQELWDAIEDRAPAFDLTAAQEAELDRRYARYRADPSRAIPLEQVLARYESRE